MTPVTTQMSISLDGFYAGPKQADLRDFGLDTGLEPSMTVGCGTFGGDSTTETTSRTRILLSIKRVAFGSARQLTFGARAAA